jgi:large repetitive protein
MKRSIVRSLTLVLVLTMLFGFAPSHTLAQATADLALSKSADRTKVKIGENVTYTLTLTNLGPATATNIVFGDPLPDPLNLVSFSCSAGTQQGGPFCFIESLASGASVTAILVATPVPNLNKQERRISNTAFISDESLPPGDDPGNNRASVTIRVIGKLSR